MSSSIYTYSRLREISRAADAANLASDIANASIADLAQVVRRQQAAIRDLSVTVTVLAELIVAAGTIDGAALVQRIEAGIAEQQSTSEEVTCSACRQQVPSARTDIRATGIICDACVAKGL
jgi:formylmethanofuran dehydrogenase subunit E